MAYYKQAKLAAKDDIADFMKKTDFDDQRINTKKKVTSNKKKHIAFEKKPNDQLSTYTKLTNDLSTEFK